MLRIRRTTAGAREALLRTQYSELSTDSSASPHPEPAHPLLPDAVADGAEEAVRDDGFAEGVADVGEELADLGDVETGHDDDLRQHVRLGAVEVLHDVRAADLGE